METKRKFEMNADQSMLSHLLNGIFPSLRLMHLLEAEGLGRFSEVERRVYILSYLMHDVDKIKQRTVETKTREEYRAVEGVYRRRVASVQCRGVFPRGGQLCRGYHLPGSQYTGALGNELKYLSVAISTARKAYCCVAAAVYLF